MVESKPDKMAVSRELRVLRESLGLSKDDIALELNISPITWNNYEEGKTLIKPAVVEQLETTFGIHINYFTVRKDEELTLGGRINRVRRYLNKVIDEFAKDLQTKPEVIMSMESDKRLQTYNHIYENMIKIYDINLNWLFTGRGEMLNKK